jgi:hypothetical protein
VSGSDFERVTAKCAFGGQAQAHPESHWDWNKTGRRLAGSTELSSCQQVRRGWNGALRATRKYLQDKQILAEMVGFELCQGL